jgi:hypothetical protein
MRSRIYAAETRRESEGLARGELGKRAVWLTLLGFNAELILGFLTHLEAERGRNAQLAAMRAFT